MVMWGDSRAECDPGRSRGRAGAFPYPASMGTRGIPGHGAPGVGPRSRPGARPAGVITRGTTNSNRLRRVDRWLTGVHGRLLRGAADPLVVDLGYGASPVTTVELLRRLRTVRADVRVVGFEIDPERVSAPLPPPGPLPSCP